MTFIIYILVLLIEDRDLLAKLDLLDLLIFNWIKPEFQNVFFIIFYEKSVLVKVSNNFVLVSKILIN